MLRLLCIPILCCLLRGMTWAQADYGVDEYVTGMTLIGKSDAGPDCPPIVWIVEPDTPAAKAGIHPGDRLKSIDGNRVVDVVQARPFLRTSRPNSSTIELEGQRGPYTVLVGRVSNSILDEREGLKRGPDGGLYPKDATLAEMQRVSKITKEPATKVFAAGHYPVNQEIYYPGFEIFVWPEPQTMTVGGIEDGPAKAAGVHYGDSIVSVNGVQTRGKSLTELEQLFSSPIPATMTLVIDRDGQVKKVTFELAKASDVAEANYKRMYKGRMIPSVIPPAYLHCFEPTPH